VGGRGNCGCAHRDAFCDASAGFGVALQNAEGVTGGVFLALEFFGFLAKKQNSEGEQVTPSLFLFGANAWLNACLCAL
jgi:hypothetical protein